VGAGEFGAVSSGSSFGLGFYGYAISSARIIERWVFKQTKDF